MWYRGIIGSFIGGINEIYDFFHFPLVIWSKQNQISNKNFHFKIQKWKFSKKNNFKIQNWKFSKKIKFQKWKFSIFRGIFQFFFISPWWYGQIFSNFKIYFYIFSISLWWHGQNFFKIQNKIFQFKFRKRFFSNFPCGTNNFFSRPEFAKFIKRLQKISIYPYKNSHIVWSTLKEPLFYTLIGLGKWRLLEIGRCSNN
jgi:hypothetical protein